MSLTQNDVVRILRTARDKGATEVHFKAPNRPLFRIGGVLLTTDNVQLSPQDTHQIALALCALARLELPLATITDHEFGLGLPSIGRFRVQLYRQRGSISILVHRMSLQVPTLADLGFPSDVDQVVVRPGLSVIGGGVRRHAVMASLVDRFNTTLRGHAVVAENPLTWLHRDALASVAQRDVGIDVPDFYVAVRNAIKQQADLVASGDVPDRETAEALLLAGENGMSVLACVASRSAGTTTWQILRQFPPEWRSDAEKRLASVLVSTFYIPDNGPTEFFPSFDMDSKPSGFVLPRAAAAASIAR